MNRTLALAHKYLGGALEVPAEGPLLALAESLPEDVDAHLANSDFRGAATAVCRVSEEVNRVFAEVRPWVLGKEGRLAELSRFLGEVVGTCRILARELSPFIPGGAQRLADQLAEGPTLPAPSPVFPRLEPKGGA